MSNDRMIGVPARLLASEIAAAERSVDGVPDSKAHLSRMLLSMMHQHDGGMMQIAWNDVQAIISKNSFIRGKDILIPVPASASEAYNVHRHTSEYDGGVIPGARGVHNHTDNENGGLAFACFAPSTSIPQKIWE